MNETSYGKALVSAPGRETAVADPDWPFFPTTRNTTGLVYAVLTVLRWKDQHNLVNGQVAWLGQPASGRFNAALTLDLYVLVAQPHVERQADDKPDRVTFQFALDGDETSRALHSESAVYSFHPDSPLGFLGCTFAEPRGLDVNEMAALAVAINRFSQATPPRNPDPTQTFGACPLVYPRFYRVARKGGGEMFEVTRGVTMTLEEIPEADGPLFLPSVVKDTAWTKQRHKLELFQSPEHVFVGTESMAFIPRQAGGEMDDLSVSQDQFVNTVQDMSDGFAAQTLQGLFPSVVQLPRLQNPVQNNKYLNQALNAYGQRLWKLKLGKLQH